MRGGSDGTQQPFPMAGLACLLALTGLAGLASGPLAAQVTTHPRDLGLAVPDSPRPDPDDHRIVLDNGLVAYVAVDDSAPLVTLTAFVRAGYADGPEGAAELVAHGLRTKGPAGMDASTFHTALGSMAADYRVELGPERLEITLDVPAGDAGAALELLAALVVDGPALDASDAGGLRERAGRSAEPSARSGPSPASIYEGSMATAVELFRAHVLDGTPYGGLPAADRLSRLTVADARAFHERFFTTGNLVIAVAGSFEQAGFRSELATRFANLRAGERHRRDATVTPSHPERRRISTYPASKLQGWLVIGHVLPPVPLEDRAPLEVMNYILGGGHFDTRLFRATRDQRGLTNDDSGYLEAYDDGPGTYSFHTSGRPEAVRLLLHLTLDEIDRIRSEPVTEEELFVARGALADGVFAAGYRDGWATARTLALEWIAHGSHERSAGYPERVRAVTAEDVLEAARTYLHPGRMQAVLVGPIDEIEAARALEGEGPLSAYGQVVRH